MAPQLEFCVFVLLIQKEEAVIHKEDVLKSALLKKPHDLYRPSGPPIATPRATLNENVSSHNLRRYLRVPYVKEFLVLVDAYSHY